MIPSETPLPADATIQVNAAVWRRHSRLGCQMGVQLVLVLPYSVRATACL